MFRKIARSCVFIVSLSFILVPSIAKAGDFTGTISDILSGPSMGTNLIIAVNGQVNNKIGCNTNSYWDFSINTQAVGANTWVSLILTAFSTGKQVVITGTGACGNWHNIEDLSDIRILQ